MIAVRLLIQMAKWGAGVCFFCARLAPLREAVLILLFLRAHVMSAPAPPHILRPPRSSSLQLLSLSGYGLPGALCSASLLGIPLELQIEILSCFYSDVYLLIRLRLVCKRFRSIIRALCVNWRIGPGSRGRKMRDRIAGKMASMFPNIFSIQLHGCGALTNGVFAHLQALHSLAHLDICDNALLTGEGLEWLAGAPLRALFLENCGGVNNDGLAAIGQLRQLEVLQLQGCPLISDKGLRPLTALPRLEWLSLRRCDGLSDLCMRSVSQMSGLRVLTLPARVSDRALRAGLPPLGRLQGLFVAHAPVRDRALLAALSPLPPLQLTQLCLFGCSKLTDGGLLALTSRFPRLTLLNVGACPQLSAAGLAAALTAVAELRVLHLDGLVRAVDDALLAALARTAPLLRKLNLKHCALLSDAGVLELARLPALECIALRGCARVSADALNTLRTAAAPRLLDIRM